MTTTDPDLATLSTVLAGAGGMNLGQILDAVVQYAEELKHDPSNSPSTVEGLLDDLGTWVHAFVEMETEPEVETEPVASDLITVRISTDVQVSPAFVAYTRDLVESPDLSVRECVLTALDSALENTEEMAVTEGLERRPMIDSPLVGRRVRLLRCADEFTRLVPGLEGTVRLVDGVGTVHVNWDNGATLGLVPDEDDWIVLP